jgi:magnesium chelatase family protein
MVGPPGSGKTMLANRLPGLLPPLGPLEALDATRVHSAAGERVPPNGLLLRPPFRAPHHSASMVALIGGGSSWLRPGEASLAHGGVLFLDELAEFPPTVLDALRQPLEDGAMRVARAHGSVTFPARFLLVAATNPCPCGQAGSEMACRCPDHARRRYGRRLSGPLLDRFDLRVHVARPKPEQLADGRPVEASVAVAERVAAARARAGARGMRSNAELNGRTLERFAPLSRAARRLLTEAVAQNRLSARGYQRARRVARTVADLAGAAEGPLSEEHVAVALQLRMDVGPLIGQVAA